MGAPCQCPSAPSPLVQPSNQAGGPVSLTLITLGVLGTMVTSALVTTVCAFPHARRYSLGHHEGGSDFEPESPPTCSDFAYLASTVGMSFAVSEIEPTRSDTRCEAVPRALLSYLLGTVLIAVAINLGEGS